MNLDIANRYQEELKAREAADADSISEEHRKEQTELENAERNIRLLANLKGDLAAQLVADARAHHRALAQRVEGRKSAEEQLALVRRRLDDNTSLVEQREKAVQSKQLELDAARTRLQEAREEKAALGRQAAKILSEMPGLEPDPAKRDAAALDPNGDDSIRNEMAQMRRTAQEITEIQDSDQEAVSTPVTGVSAQLEDTWAVDKNGIAMWWRESLDQELRPLTINMLRKKFQELRMALGQEAHNLAQIASIHPPVSNKEGQPLPVERVYEVFLNLVGPRLSET